MRIPTVLLISIGLSSSSAFAQGSSYRLFGYGAHANTGEVVYHYRVVNGSGNSSTPAQTGQIEIGRVSLDDEPELVTLPVYDGPQYGERVARIGAPAGWKGYVGGREEHPRCTIVWEADDSTPPLSPGQTLNNLNVTLPQIDSTYLTGHFLVVNDDSSVATGTIEQEDKSPPVVTLSASPNILWPPNSKYVPVTIALTEKDDYDPHPAIKLESITANEPLGPEDVVDATIGTDDRSFSLKATRSGTNPAGRVYTITYSATDGTGNKTTTSTTVTVPHDRRK